MPSGGRLMSGALMALAMMGAIWLAAFHDPSIGQHARNQALMLGAAVGLFFGWTMLGRKLGRGFPQTMGWALSTMVVTGFWFLAIIAARTTTLATFAGQHRGRPMQALEALVEQFLIYAQFVTDLRVLVAAAVGALVAGAMGEYARMIWN